MTLRKTSKRKAPRWAFLAMAVIGLLIVASVGAVWGAAGDVSLNAGFEGNDGNLTPGDDPNGGSPGDSPNFDWNSFDPIDWDEGTAPTRQSHSDEAGWALTALEDYQATTSDSGFAGGTKQDNECPSVITAKAPNKDDLKRAYVASTTGDDDHTYLALAWVRIPQNTTSPSAHVAFEFNQADEETAPCGAGSDSLVERTEGDMLVVYDFEGGSGDLPSLKLSRWLTSAGVDENDDPWTAADCEVAKALPCWGDTQNLTAQGFAEGRVNTSLVGSVADALSPPASPATESVTVNLGVNEFGEAVIDLTDAGVFDPDECVAFGSVYAVSRSSGNSAQAQMKDLVGPGEIDLQNCGSVIIRKVTEPTPDPLDTAFDFTTTGGLDPSTFDLKDGESQDYGAEVQAGSYSVTEPGEANYVLTDIDCSDSSLTNGSTIDIGGGAGDTDEGFQAGDDTVDFDLVGKDSIDCTFTNSLQTGAIKVTKTAKDANCALEEGAPAGCDESNNAPLAGAAFEIWLESNEVAGLQTEADEGDPNDPNDDVPADTKAAGPQSTALNDDEDEASTCFDGLLFATYYVYESDAPAGYAADATNPKSVPVDSTAACDDEEYAGEEISFTNTPLSEIEVIFRSLAGPGVTASTIDCSPGDSGDETPTDFDDTDEIITDLEPGTYTCVIVVDP